MKQRQREQVQRGCAVGTMVLLAWLCRVLPAVQDAKLIQTGTSGWLADLMLGAGMVLSAAGYWMERKRKAMFYKSQH